MQGLQVSLCTSSVWPLLTLFSHWTAAQVWVVLKISLNSLLPPNLPPLDSFTPEELTRRCAVPVAWVSETGNLLTRLTWLMQVSRRRGLIAVHCLVSSLTCIDFSPLICLLLGRNSLSKYFLKFYFVLPEPCLIYYCDDTCSGIIISLDWLLYVGIFEKSYSSKMVLSTPLAEYLPYNGKLSPW